MKSLLCKSVSYLKQASPLILACMGGVGVVATAVMAVKATPKAVKLCEALKREKENESKGEPTKLEYAKAAWRCYIPAAVVGVSTIACILGVNVLGKRNQASMASAYALLHQFHQRYKNAANTVFGGKADSKIKAQMAKDVYVSADGYSVYSDDLDAESEKILCYDLYSQRYFSATMASVLNAQYHLNRNLALRGNACVNELYEFLGIDKLDCGDEVGWSMDEFMENGITWLDFENRRVDMDDGMQCCVISVLWEPDLLNPET